MVENALMDIMRYGILSNSLNRVNALFIYVDVVLCNNSIYFNIISGK